MFSTWTLDATFVTRTCKCHCASREVNYQTTREGCVEHKNIYAKTPGKVLQIWEPAGPKSISCGHFFAPLFDLLLLKQTLCAATHGRRALCITFFISALNRRRPGREFNQKLRRISLINERPCSRWKLMWAARSRLCLWYSERESCLHCLPRRTVPGDVFN